jgi:acyl-CoA thioesterase I
MKMALQKHWVAAAATLAILFCTLPARAVTVISCAGTSVTMTSQYPELLQKDLGSDYKVWDEGAGGADAGYGWNHFVATTNFAHIVSIKPQIIALEFGANDAHAPADWIDANFYAMYSKFVDTFYTISPKPIVYVCLPPPNFMVATTPPQNAPFIVSLEHIVVQLKKLVADRHLPCLDFNTPLLGHPEYTTDGCHMPAQGAGADTMAHVFMRALQALQNGTSVALESHGAATFLRALGETAGHGLSITLPGSESWTLTISTLDGKELGRYAGKGSCRQVFSGNQIGTGVVIARLHAVSGEYAHTMTGLIR